MDWAVWHQTLDQDALEGNFMGTSQGDFYFCPGMDVIEENALNEKSCIQVLQLLISSANAEILELEEDLIILQSQLAWADESWSETCSAALNGKIDYLDISLRRLENADVHDEHDISCGLLSDSKPADKIHQLLLPLLENYFHHEPGQNEQTAYCIVSNDDLPLETEKKCVAEKEKHAYAIIKHLSSDTSGRETDEVSEKKELVKIDGNDGLRQNNSASKERNLVTVLKTAGKGRILPRTFEPSSASSFDASKQADSLDGKDSRIDSKVKGRKEVKGQNSMGQIIILKSSIWQEGTASDISGAPADVNPKLTEGLDSALINDIERPISSFMVGKKRNKSLQKLTSPDDGRPSTENKPLDLLPQLLNNQKELKGKSKLAAIVGKSNPNLSPRPQKQSNEREHQKKQKAKRVPHVDEEKKRKRPSLPGVEEAKKLNGTTAGTNAEDPSDRSSSDTKCLFTGDSVNRESPRPSPAARALDLEHLTLVDLRAIAKQQKMKGYTLLKKSKLTEELSLKLRA